MLVADIMRKAEVAEENVALGEAARIIAKKRGGCLLVVDKGKLQGILTEQDIVKHFDRKEKVSEAMTRNPATIGAEDDVLEALELMRSKNVQRLPVIDKGKLVGLISVMDIIAHWSSLGSDEDFFFD